MELKCPNCGSNDVKFQPEKQYCYCEYCGSKIEIGSLETQNEMPKTQAIQEQINEKQIPTKQDVEYDEYTCSSCGAKLITDENTIVTYCVYCGNQQLLKEKMQGSFAPNGIIPFKVSKDEFIKIYNSYLDKKSYRDEFRNEIKILELKGVYIPAYIYDMDVDVYDRGNFVYKTDDTRVEKPYETRFQFEVFSIQDASSYYDDELIAAIEPFDLTEIVEYQPGFLSGFLADRGNITAKVMSNKAEERVKKAIDNEILTKLNKHFFGRWINEMKTHEITSYYKENGAYVKKVQRLGDLVDNFNRGSLEGGGRCINIKNTSNQYVLLPVWFVTTMYKDKKYWIAVNGQTAKVDSLLPPDRIGILKNLRGPIIVAVALLSIVSFIMGHNFSNFPSHKGSSFGIIGIIYFIGMMIYLAYNIYRDYVFRDKYYPKDVYELSLDNKRYSLFKNYEKRDYIKAFGSQELANNKRLKLFHDGISVDYTRWEDEIK